MKWFAVMFERMEDQFGGGSIVVQYANILVVKGRTIEGVSEV